MTPLGMYLYRAMVSWAPLSDHAFAEAPIVTEARYLDIAESTADIARENPPLFPDDVSRVETGLWLTAIASFESGGFATAVQRCQRNGDHNKALSLWQVHGSPDELCNSVWGAAQVALDRVRHSLESCAHNPRDARLAEYTGGSCTRGLLASEKRVRRAEDYLAAHPFE